MSFKKPIIFYDDTNSLEELRDGDLPVNLHSGSLNIDFGISGDFLISTVNNSWVTDNHYGKIKCEVLDDGIDHIFGEAALGSLTASAGNIIPGVSFDIIITSQHDTWGRYIIKYNEII